MTSINRVLLVGHLTRDPELRHTAGGTAVCEFSMALNSREKVNGEWDDRVDYFDIVVWGNQGENCAQYLAKGKLVGVDGRLRQDRWEDKDSGQKRSRVKITADAIQFLTPGEGGGHSQSDFVPTGAEGPPQDDIPF